MKRHAEIYKPTTDRKRRCLKCEKAFDSNGAHNRICPTCDDENGRIRGGRLLKDRPRSRQKGVRYE